MNAYLIDTVRYILQPNTIFVNTLKMKFIWLMPIAGDYEGIYFNRDGLPFQVIQLQLANADGICRDFPYSDVEICIFHATKDDADQLENPHDFHHVMEILYFLDE